MRQLLLAVAMLILFGGAAFAQPPQPHPTTISSTVTDVTVASGGGTSTINPHSSVTGIGTVALGASITTKSTVGIAASFSVGFTTP
jgi:hypothetical protein